MRYAAPLLVVGALALCGACGATGEEASIERAETRVWLGTVEVARTEADRRRGLRGHASLALGQGLVLEAPIEDELCIDNGGVEFAIDAAFADEAGLVVAIEREVGAGDASVRCHRPARFILEVGAGELTEARAGDLLRYASQPARR